jgi:uncharacterized membrane protein
MNARFGSLHLGILGLAVLAALQVFWHGWLLPPAPAQRWPTLALAIAPLLPGLWISRHDPRRGVLVGGIVSLFYFCHGIAAAWSDPPARALGIAEVVLALGVIGASGWDARHYRRPPK